MDALSLLKQDHDKAKEVIKKIEKTTERAKAEREELFQGLVDDLTVHERIEEEIFYPTLQRHPRAKELVLEAYVEHDVVDSLTDETSIIPADDESWMPHFKVFRENLEHHIEEEEGELFPKTNELLSKDELEDLGEKMAALKEQARQDLLEEAEES
ncbi:MAG TPA: hemerythrin domain-containing protein [Candidatus Limnocylindria bacterium]|jgi:hemerythrin-like domain-containing protein|nr:hemerythrin domain-containing protein [Candidatus Limnocylindria bacterium]